MCVFDENAPTFEMLMASGVSQSLVYLLSVRVSTHRQPALTAGSLHPTKNLTCPDSLIANRGISNLIRKSCLLSRKVAAITTVSVPRKLKRLQPLSTLRYFSSTFIQSRSPSYPLTKRKKEKLPPLPIL